MPDGPHLRRRVLVTMTRGGAGAQPAGGPVGYAALGGVATAPTEGEQAPPAGQAPELGGAPAAPAAPREAPP